MNEESNSKRKIDDVYENEISITNEENKSCEELKNEEEDLKHVIVDSEKNDEIQMNDSTEQSNKKLKKTTFYDENNLSLSMITLKKVIHIRLHEKAAVLEGEYNGDRVLIFIEKLPFDDESVQQLFVEPIEMTKIIQNDIYGSFAMEPQISNKMKTTIICPATDRHFQKYLESKWIMIEETADHYRDITLPYLKENDFTLEWVYNILEHKQESERIVFEDSDDVNGFVLLPDLKWDGINLKKFYLVAIVKRRDIRSIRDLRGEHLPLLLNLKNKIYEVVKQKYAFEPEQMHLTFHYRPSYEHLHLHVQLVQSIESPRLYIGSSHLLDTVISNLQISTEYYAKVTLPFRVKVASGLYEYYKKRSQCIEEPVDTTSIACTSICGNDPNSSESRVLIEI